MSGQPPYFSIIIPMYNRARFIARALHSCLCQDFVNFEIVVVDDGSTDGSVDVVQRFTDPRIRLICHEVNRGRCPSRNTGMQVSRGVWYIFLDSDDELLPGALHRIHQRAVGLCDDVGGMRFMCQDEDGQLSPDPPLCDEVWDYAGYIRRMETSVYGKEEALPCVRASTFPQVQYPNDHSGEGLYHLNIAKLFLVRSCSDVVRLYHHDADNRITRPIPSRSLQYAHDAANDVANVLCHHGHALQQWAPTLFERKFLAGALLNFLAGDRIKGLQYAFGYLRFHPGSIQTYVIMIAGMLGPRLLAWLQSAKARLEGL